MRNRDAILSVIDRLETALSNTEYSINRLLTREEVLAELDNVKELVDMVKTYVEREDQTYN